MKSPLTFFLFISLFTFLDLSVCAEPQPKVPLQARKEWKFENEGIVFSNDFSGARLNDCSQIEKNIFKVTIEPENHPINRSPWYAFKISSAKKQSIQVRFNLTHPGIASKPKISLDGRQWQPLEKKLWTPADSEKKTPATALLDIGAAPLWVFALAYTVFAALVIWAWRRYPPVPGP